MRAESYAPDGWISGIHEVEADDARQWSTALDECVRALDAGTFDLPTVAQPALIRDGMTLDQFRQANRGLTPQFGRSFAAFMAKGPFQFGWDS